LPNPIVGCKVPRLWTKPLRELHDDEPGGRGAATSRGFEVLLFAKYVLGVTLWPWQEWLLIHALELNPDGTYRFRKIIVLVGRQNGKTTVASVLAAWWLFQESRRNPEQVPPLKFKVVGVAQTLDIAREIWGTVKVWCDPDPDTDEDKDLAIPDLQRETKTVIDTNGALAIVARNRAHYEIRAAKNARGKPAARVLMDELREQKDWVGWNAVSQTTKNFWNGQMFGFSNAGDSSSVVLAMQRAAGLSDIKDWDAYVATGLRTAEEWANDHDPTLALFEWSAPEGCAKDDVEGILQANPSIGHGAMSVAICLADIRGMTDAGYRTEVLCQWVTANVNSHIDIKEWTPLQIPPKSLVVPKGSRTVWGIDTSWDRSMTWIAGAVVTEDGRPFVTVRIKRAGMLWVPEYMESLAEESGQLEVALQQMGTPAMEFIAPLEELGFTVHALPTSVFALATGRIWDRVHDKQLVIVHQPDVDLAVQGGVVTTQSENLAWNRAKSLPIDISGLVAETCALYGLEVLEPPKVIVPKPPPKAELVPRAEGSPTDTNLRNVQF
jgi:hypothetical protein